MRIAIPVEGKTMAAYVCLSFARAPYMMLYDSLDGKALWMDNMAANSQGGAGIKAAQMLIDCGAEIVLAPQCGVNAAAVLGAANVKIHRATLASAVENIEAYMRGELQELADIHGGFHRDGVK